MRKTVKFKKWKEMTDEEKQTNLFPYTIIAGVVLIAFTVLLVILSC